MMKKRKHIQDILDGGDEYEDAPHWVVEFNWDSDDRNLTPLQAARLALKEIHHGHSCMVYHVRSGLQWSVCLERSEVVECKQAYPPPKPRPNEKDKPRSK
jgi:hypothetical protein